MPTTVKKILKAVGLTGNNMVVQVQENQKDLLWTCETCASDGTVDDCYKGLIEKHHGRVERRSVEVFKNFTALYPEK